MSVSALFLAPTKSLYAEAVVKYTLFLTLRCNLACDYCYVRKAKAFMPLEVADLAVKFALSHTPQSEDVEIGFFGGEPLLAFPLLKEITSRIESHPQYDPKRVKLSITTNGTLVTAEILDFFGRHRIAMCISCDGPPAIQDRHRHFADGAGSSRRVEEAIRMSLAAQGRVVINAVFGPGTLSAMPETLEYFSSLGVRQVHFSPDFSAKWTENDAQKVPDVYQALADRYMKYYREGRPHFISLLDNKITVMLRGGYQKTEKCRMGEGEFAFSPTGQIYACERLAGVDAENHVVGTVNGLVQIGALPNHFAPGAAANESCLQCSVRDYCVHWCGCSNYFMSGYYNRVSPFLCMSERTALRLATRIFQTLETELGPIFLHHLGKQDVRWASDPASCLAHPV